MLALGAGLALIMARALVWPIRHLTELSRRIAAGDRDISVQTDEVGEIGELAKSMQAMADRLRHDERDRRREAH